VGMQMVVKGLSSLPTYMNELELSPYMWDVATKNKII
jgi:hypothetical protein